MKTFAFVIAGLHLSLAYSSDDLTVTTKTAHFQVRVDKRTRLDLENPSFLRAARGKPVDMFPAAGIYVGLRPSKLAYPSSSSPSNAWLRRLAVSDKLPKAQLSLTSDPNRNRTLLVRPGQLIVDASWPWRRLEGRVIRQNLKFADIPRTPVAMEEYSFERVEVSPFPISLRDPAGRVFTSQIIVSGNMGGGLTDQHGAVAVSDLPTELPIEMCIILTGLNRKDYFLTSPTLKFDDRWGFRITLPKSGKALQLVEIRKRKIPREDTQ
ncbi:MAG: hypothetical protein ABJZ55_20210 [Fuerstiella sp.]